MSSAAAREADLVRGYKACLPLYSFLWGSGARGLRLSSNGRPEAVGTIIEDLHAVRALFAESVKNAELLGRLGAAFEGGVLEAWVRISLGDRVTAQKLLELRAAPHRSPAS